jgi:V8-like Glu-specific endopeptidase
MQKMRGLLLLAGTAICFAGMAASKPAPSADASISYVVQSGLLANTQATTVVAFAQVVMVPRGNLMRLHFDSLQLGRESFVRVTSLKDRDVQRLDARAMANWKNTTAIFNGDTLLLEVCVASGESGIFANMDRVVFAESSPTTFQSASLVKSLCGGDGRVASTDNRVGRINGCTAWLVSNGAVLTAGHCTSGGTLNGVFSVNVPLSQSDGTAVASATIDQFPLDTSNLSFENGGNSGDDWTVFGLSPNSSGESAHVKFGFFRLTRNSPSAGSTVRVTGFGVDNTPSGTGSACCATDSNGNCTHTSCNSRNRTLQTATGPFNGESSSGANFWHRYSVDTEPANSGSPIIWEANGFAIGIHTNGGCDSDGSGENTGTSFEHDALENAVQNYPGSGTRYVDTVTYPGGPTDSGNIFAPYHDLPSAVTSVPSGGQVSIVQGSYTSAAGNTGVFGTGNKAMVLLAPVGSVTIGN